MAKYLITSALPYINGIKHLGNLIGSMLPADVATRYLRMKGHDVIYICGTDEHGAPAEIAAKQENVSVEAFCDKFYQLQVKTYEDFQLSFDYFGRTSSDAHIQLTQDYFLKLWENGYIAERESSQMYSEADQMFLADRYIEGTCPICQSAGARGDQCDTCGSLLTPEELIDPYSVISGSKKLSLKKTKHLFLKLDSLQEQVAEFVASRKNQWPNVVSGIAQKWLNQGLQERSITRDLYWGVPVPLEGYPEKVFYVWFDAPFGYISFTQEHFTAQGNPEKWRDYWADPDTTYIQFMAKDNVPFHSIFWPAIIKGTGADVKLPDIIKGVNWLSFEGGKFSTSKNRGIFLDQALELYPSDYWRYYLLKITPESGDSNFLWTGFQEAVNKDLADTLGNFINRIIVFFRRSTDGVVPEQIDLDPAVESAITKSMEEIGASLDQLKFTTAVQDLRKFWQFGNQFFNEMEPFRLIKTDEPKAINYAANCLLLIKHFAIAAAPFIPDLAQNIYKVIGLNGTVSEEAWRANLDWSDFAGLQLPEGNNVLIQKIDHKTVTALQEQY